LEESNDKQYKDSIMVDFFGDKCAFIAEVKPGDILKVLFNPRAKEYNGRRYNSLNGWKVELIQKNGGS
jgi:single-strand DNA-binding protein